MFAIFKRELRAYFTSPLAYVVIGFFTLISAVFFYLINLMGQYADFTGTMSNLQFILLFVMPVLTMRILSEDRKNGTEILLITSPTSVNGIVLGKFFAACCVFLMMTVVSFIFPATLFIFAKPPVAQLIGAYIGFILIGAAFIAVGVFASSLTESQVVAGVVTVISLVLMWVMDSVASYVGGIPAKVLNWFSLLSRYQDFSKGILNLSPIIYYISFTAVFVFLTTRVIEKRRWSQG